jgi:hypothetical protein
MQHQVELQTAAVVFGGYVAGAPNFSSATEEYNGNILDKLVTSLNTVRTQ